MRHALLVGISIGLGLLLLTACGSTSTPTPVARLTSPTLTAEPTATPACTNTPLPTATSTPAPTSTPVPTATWTPSPLPTQTPTPRPTKTPTLAPDGDYDGDGLSNQDELSKYETDPYDSDSDGDGTPDGAWDERREYVYSVHAVIKIRQPFDVDEMNDPFQDVKAIAGPDDRGYTELDILIFPDAKPPLVPAPYPLEGLTGELLALTEPGISTNYSPAMQSEVLQIVAEAETDVGAVGQVLQWVSQKTTQYVDQSIPEVYFTYLEGGEVKVRNYTGPLPVEELLETHYFADSMFRMRTHGTCTSIATLKCAMIKAAGIPCRVLQTIPLIYYHGDQTEPYANNLDREWGCVLEQPSGQGSMWANHAFPEVYLGGRWIRVDWTVNIRYEDPNCLTLKILSVPDFGEVDFSETWPVDWIHNRPYYTLLLEDQEPQH